MSTGIVIGSVFLTRNELLRMEELSVYPTPNFIHDSGFKINEYCSWHMFPRIRLAEERTECIMPTSIGALTANQNFLLYEFSVLSSSYLLK